MRVSSQFAHSGISLLFLFALGYAVWQEWGSGNNPSRPLPRPCKLVLPTLGFTGLYVGAMISPSVAFWLTLGVVGGAVLQDQGIFNAVASTFNRAAYTAQAAK